MGVAGCTAKQCKGDDYRYRKGWKDGLSYKHVVMQACSGWRGAYQQAVGGGGCGVHRARLRGLGAGTPCTQEGCPDMGSPPAARRAGCSQGNVGAVQRLVQQVGQGTVTCTYTHVVGRQADRQAHHG